MSQIDGCINLLSSVRTPLIIKFVVFLFVCLCVDYMKAKWMTMNRGKKRRHKTNEIPIIFIPLTNCCYLYVQHFVKIFTFILDTYHIFFVKFYIFFQLLTFVLFRLRIYSFQDFANSRNSSWFVGFSFSFISFCDRPKENLWIELMKLYFVRL